MDALLGFLVYGASVAAIIAAAAGSNGPLWWANLLITVAGGPALAMGLSIATRDIVSGVEASALAFAVPLIGLSVAVYRQSSQQVAAESVG
ncbi:hypothetical protein AYM40_03390 [Paraburkholderia phytofirmans OLGA172]|uniref:Uncharacterized protein n=1 Tax=Paraburkholderia phytofirmans OLGA172 TaxID=1417228 RepID=A0A160FI71_9BURK|nr:hypothetical protein [Paraburkholderia phytofirmans]ANB71516.1 hypothetical protein AYM40_03390 [Paraburkholderia phytofirmans OLGA172]